MASLLVVSNELSAGVRPEAVLPAVALLPHDLRSAPADTTALTESAKADVIVIDGRNELANARMICRLFISSGITLPLLLVVTEGGLAAINGDWGVTDLILDGAGPAEFDARIRLLLSSTDADGLIQAGGIVI